MSVLESPDAVTAWAAWLDAIERAGGLEPLTPESVALEDACDRVAAEAVYARRSSPVADASDTRLLGEDVAAGDLLVRPGQVLEAPLLGVLAAAGETAVTVRRRPVVALVTTGSPPGADVSLHQPVRPSAVMLAAAAAGAGAVVRAHDGGADQETLAHAIAEAASDADLVLLLSPSPSGADALAAAAIARVGELVVRGVAIRPGHPVALARAGRTPVLGVPGYAVSAGIAFDLLGLRMLTEIEGRPRSPRERVWARAGTALASDPENAAWLRLQLVLIGDDVLAVPLRRGAGVLTSLARADALACLPPGSNGLAEGDALEVELLRPWLAIERTAVVAGSTDPMLDGLAAAAEVARRCDGSATGAAELAARRCHAALVVREDAPSDAVVLASFARPVGLVVARGNPLALTGVDDLRRPDVRLAGRPRGSSTRRLLDALLAEHGIDPGEVRGYGREYRSHAAAAAAVEAGAADCAVASACVTRHADVDVLPLVTQELVLVTTAELAGDPRVERLRMAVAAA